MKNISKRDIRFFLLGALFMLAIFLLIGWKDFVSGFNEGFNNSRNNIENSK